MTFHKQSNIWKIGSVAFEGKHIGGQKREDEDESHVEWSWDEVGVVDVVERCARHGRRGREDSTEIQKTDRINRCVRRKMRWCVVPRWALMLPAANRTGFTVEL